MSISLDPLFSRTLVPGQVVIRRRPLVYVVSLLIPSIFLMLVDLGSFYLPPTCRARIVFKTSVLVGYTVFRVNMSDEMPRSATSTPLIGKQPRGCPTPILHDSCERPTAALQTGGGKRPPGLQLILPPLLPSLRCLLHSLHGLLGSQLI